MNTAITSISATPVPPKRVRRKRSRVLTPVQRLELMGRLRGPHLPEKSKAVPVDLAQFQTGQPRPGSRLERFLAKRLADPIHEDGLVYVSVEGNEHRRAILGASAFARITSRDPAGPWLTRTRWWLDDAGNMRAYSLHDRQPFTHGVLVAAAILGADAGQTIEVPADPFDLRLSALRRVE